MRFRVLDIETVPDTTVWTPSEPKWRWEPKSIGAYGYQRSVLENENCFSPKDLVLVKEDPFPPPHACRVVAISWVDVVLDVEKSPRYSFDSMSSDCRWSLSGHPDEERELLRSFGATTQMRSSEGGLCLVTWNGRGFDLPVISLRSLMHGVPCKWYYENRDVRYRYSAEGHIDLMDFLGDYGAARNMKLHDVARLVGLPGKTDMTGASVSDVYESTLARDVGSVFCDVQRSSVARYCLQDSLQTALIFLRTRFHLGKIDRDEYERCLGTFEQHAQVRELIKVDWKVFGFPGASS